MIQGLGKQIISEAMELQVKDIYILPEENGYQLFFRIHDER